MAHWLNGRCGTSLVTAREQLRSGAALGGLPVIRGRFGEGRLTCSQVRAVTRVADGRTDELLADLAGAMTASQLEEVVRAFRRSGEIGADEAVADIVDALYQATQRDSAESSSGPEARS
jgi:hypothetical protein